MKKLLAFLLQPPIPQLLGLLLLSAVVWFGGRALRSWLGLSDGTLGLIIGAIWLIALLVFVWRRYQSGKRARLIEDRLRGQAREHIESVRPDKRSQVEELEKQLGTALATLKKSKLGKGALYELPWYVIIGPPGSGKTTLLRESNLSFPDETHGRGVRGMGGTRNCDWWFTDQGILLDTAGRYTTQDEDRNEWMQFLDMLKKARARKPINGAMIAISIADVIQASPEELAEHARKIRERLAELTKKLEVVFPVYLMFSKCDLLDGFVETFGGYGKKERAQTWGVTLPYLGNGKASLAEQFDREFAALHARLCAERLQNLGQAKSQHKKTKIFGLPMQFALVREQLRSFLTQIEQANPYHESSDIRGFYFTSGTQEGQPLDQVLAGMRDACGLTAEEDSQAEEAVDKKAYFIDDLFTDVVFPDKELARSSASAEKRRGLLRKVGVLTTAAATVALLAMVVVGYAGHSSLIDRSIEAYAAVEGWQPDQETCEDEENNRGRLEQLRRNFDELHREFQSVGSYVMGQGNALYKDRVRERYVTLATEAFVKPVQLQLEQRLDKALQAGKGNVDAAHLTDLIIAYRMLAGLDPVNTEWLDNYLTGNGLWRWGQVDSTKGLQGLSMWTETETPTSRAHRETFMEQVARVGQRDWFLPEPNRTLLSKAEELRDGEDPLEEHVKIQAKKSGAETWQDRLRNCPGIQHMDPERGNIAKLFTGSVDVDDALVERGTMVDQERGGEAILEKKKALQRQAWKDALAKMRPRPVNNLKTAMQNVAELIGEDGTDCVYLRAYEFTAAKLTELGQECTIGNTDWLATLLVDIKALEDNVYDNICFRPQDARILPLAKDPAARKPLEDLSGALSALSNGIPDLVCKSNGVPALLELDLEFALTNLVGSIEYALAYEITREIEREWQNQDLGKQLRNWSTRFPFAFEAAPGETLATVPADEFHATFRIGGNYDKTNNTFAFLENVMPDGYWKRTDAFEQDRQLVKNIQACLFAGDDGKREASYSQTVAMQSSNIAQATFAVGETTLDTSGIREGTIDWQIAQNADLRIFGFTMDDADKSSKITHSGPWALLKVLAEAEIVPKQNRSKVSGWLFTWTEFPDSQDNRLEYDGKTPIVHWFVPRRETWDPFDTDDDPKNGRGFRHTFATEVFRAIER